MNVQETTGPLRREGFMRKSYQTVSLVEQECHICEQAGKPGRRVPLTWPKNMLYNVYKWSPNLMIFTTLPIIFHKVFPNTSGLDLNMNSQS